MAYNNVGIVESKRINSGTVVQCIAEGELRSFQIKSGDFTIPLFNVHYTSMNSEDIEFKLSEIVSALNR
jgi:hypothetical protein